MKNRKKVSNFEDVFRFKRKMRKIAILTSGGGECADRLVSLFNEGNRLRVESVVTDCENAGILAALAGKDVETVCIPAEKWAQCPEEVMAFFSDRDIELLALDAFGVELPDVIKEAYSGKIVALTTPEEAPREVVAAFARIDDSDMPDPEAPQTPPTPKSVDEEWAETLKMPFDSSKLRTTPPPVPGAEHPQVPPANPSASYGAPAQPEPFDAPRPTSGPAFGAGFKEPVREPMPSTYLVWAIVMTILCCTIPGIVAIVFSSQVSTRYAVGDIEGSRRASRNAEIWIIVSFVLGVISAVLYLPMMLIS